LILKHLKPQEPGLIVDESRPVEKRLPDILLSIVFHAKA
jgi:hypothetical protein